MSAGYVLVSGSTREIFWNGKAPGKRWSVRYTTRALGTAKRFATASEAYACAGQYALLAQWRVVAAASLACLSSRKVQIRSPHVASPIRALQAHAAQQVHAAVRRRARG